MIRATLIGGLQDGQTRELSDSVRQYSIRWGDEEVLLDERYFKLEKGREIYFVHSDELELIKSVDDFSALIH